MSQKHTIEAMVFDFDGTMIDTEELHRQAYNLAFLELGLGWNWSAERYAEMLSISGGEARMRHYVQSLEIPAAEKARVAHIIPQIHREKTLIYADLQSGGQLKLRPGAERLIEEAAEARVPVGIVSSSAAPHVQDAIRNVFDGRASTRIRSMIAAGDVDKRKPHPEIYTKILASMGCAGGNAVAFEDSANGVTAAKRAGLYTIVTPTRWTQHQHFANADLVLASLGDPGNALSRDESARIGGGSYLTLSALSALIGHAASDAAAHNGAR